MEAIGSCVSTLAVECFIPIIKKRLAFLFTSRNDMLAQLGKLTIAATKLKKQESEDQDWFEKVADINKRAGEVAAGDVKGCFNDIIMRYKARKENYALLMEINDLINNKPTEINDNQEALGWVSRGRSSFSAVSTFILPSRKATFNEALNSLDPRNNETQIIALCGMAGVGKTTMMERLKEDMEHNGTFRWVVRVDVGKDRVSVNDIQETVAEYTAIPLTEKGIKARAERLKKRFNEISRDGKDNILLIIDNLWEKVKLEDIGLPKPLPKGFKLLLTSREEKVCTQMGVDKLFRIEVLQELEARDLFWTTVQAPSKVDDIHPNIRQIGEEFVRICRGLPMAITIIASALHANDVEDEWKDILHILQSKTFDGLDGIFKFSYDNIKEDDEKDIFLLCGLFPENYSIRIEDLLRYRWGLKQFNVDVYTSIAKARIRTNTCINNLIRSNLLIKSHPEGCVKMHGLVRDFISMISEAHQASIVNHDMSEKQLNCTRILFKCSGMFKFHADFNFKNLALLKLLNGEGRFPGGESYYTKMEKLEVVAYENMYQPLCLHYPPTLRTLCLRSCNLEGDLSFLGYLTNLEILSFANCAIRKLPSAIKLLKKLIVLDLTGCIGLSIGDGVIKDLLKLEELYMRVSKRKSVRFTDTNCEDLANLSNNLTALELEFFENNTQPKDMSFQKLEKFKISIGCLFEYKEDELPSIKNELALVTNRTELLDCKINQLFRKTEILRLEVNDMERLEVLSMQPYDYTFCKLKVLTVTNCARLQFLFTGPVINDLIELETLTVSSCPVLESIVHDDNSFCDAAVRNVIKFHKLKYLSLEKLPKLNSFCDTAVKKMELPQLVQLTLDGIPNCTSIFQPNNSNTSATKPLLNKEVVIPKLEVLRIRRMKNLKQIWSFNSDKEEDVYSYMLREVEVKECDEIVDLFPRNPMRLLSKLVELRVEKCRSIRVLFNIGFSSHEIQSISNNSNNSSSLKSIRVHKLLNLTEVWHINDSKNNTSHVGIPGFEAVESIDIRKCVNFRNVYMVTPTTARFDMEAIKINISGLEKKI